MILKRGRDRGLIGCVTAPARLNWLQAVRSAHGAEYLAGGLAIGVGVCVLPIFLFHFPLAWWIARRTKTSLMAATAGVLASNPLTLGPIYTIDYLIGRWLFGGRRNEQLEDAPSLTDPLQIFRTLEWSDFGILFGGSVVFGLVAGIVTHWLCLRWARIFYAQREKWRARRAARRAEQAVSQDENSAEEDGPEGEDGQSGV